MNKIRRITSLVVAIAMVMSMLTICFVATVVTVSGASSVPDGTMWKFDDTFAIGDVGSFAVLESGRFGITQHDNAGTALSTTVTDVNGVASIVASNGKRAFSKSSTGIIDITPANGTSSIVYFKAPVAGTYYYNVDLEKTAIPAGVTVVNWTEFGARTSLEASFSTSWLYKNSAIGNTGEFTSSNLTEVGTIELEAGQYLVIKINAQGNTDETQTTIKEFSVCKVASDASAEKFGCWVSPTREGEYKVGNFVLGTVYNNKSFTPVYDEKLVNAWGNPTYDPITGLSDTSYTGYGAIDASTQQIAHSGSGKYNGVYDGYWAWAHATKDASGTITNYYPLFFNPQIDPRDYGVDLSPKYEAPAIIAYTATKTGKYYYDSEFMPIASATGTVITVATAKDGYMMSSDEANYFLETKITTGNVALELNGIVELKAGQSIWFIAENPDNNVSPEVGVMNLTVTYLAPHVCSEFEGADCQTAGTCVLCGEQSGTVDTSVHVSDECTYVNNGSDTHTVTHACCGIPKIEAHDFGEGICACGADYSTSSAEYVAVLTSLASSVVKGGIVDINVELTGTSTEYASGEVIIKYDSNTFTFNEAASTAAFPAGVYLSPASSEGTVILMIAGPTKTLDAGFNAVATLSFVANRNADVSNFVLESAAFSTAEQAGNGGLIAAEIYSYNVIMPTYRVTLDSTLVGNSSVSALTDYTFTPKFQGFKYSVAYKVGNGTEKAISADASGVYTIPEAEVTGPITITATVVFETSVEQYVTLDNEKAMYLVRCASNKLPEGYALCIDGNAMLWSDEYDGGAYCYLMISGAGAPDANDYEISIIESSENTVVVDYDSMDINMTGVLDANDAQLVYNMINTDYSTFDDVPMEKFLRADVNGDGIIDISDVTAICTQCAAEEAQKPNEDIVEE